MKAKCPKCGSEDLHFFQNFERSHIYYQGEDSFPEDIYDCDFSESYEAKASPVVFVCHICDHDWRGGCSVEEYIGG